MVVVFASFSIEVPAARIEAAWMRKTSWQEKEGDQDKNTEAESIHDGSGSGSLMFIAAEAIANREPEFIFLLQLRRFLPANL